MWEGAVPVTVMGSMGSDVPYCCGISRRKTSIQDQGEASSGLDNLAGKMSCETIQAKGNMFSEASEIQTSALGVERIGHFFPTWG